MVFCGREEGEEILFELEADEFFGAHETHCSWAGRVVFVPGVMNCL